MASNRFRARMQARQRPAAATPAPAADAQPHDLLEVLEHSVDFVVQTDPLGAITYLNPAARQVLGLAANGALAGLNFSHFAAPGTRRQFAEQIVPALLSRAVWVGETTLRLGPGRAMPLSLMALAHRDQNGRPLRFSAVMRDITAEVEARRQIQRQNQILSAITEALPATVVIIDSQGR